MVCHSLAGQRGLIPWQSRGSKRKSRSQRVLLGPRLGTTTVPFSLPSTILRKKANSDLKSREIDSAFYMESCKVALHKGMETGRERVLASFANDWWQCVLPRKPEGCHLKPEMQPGAGAHMWALVALNIDLWQVLLLPYLEVLLSLSRNLGV